MISEAMSPDILVPSGRVLLGGAFGFSLIRAMKGSLELQVTFERLAIGCIALAFFRPASTQLLRVSEDLAKIISNLGHEEDLRTFILNALQNSVTAPSGSGSATQFNLPAVLEQAWRTGVWGIMSTVIDWMFMIASFLLECAREVFWTLLLFLYPIACGVFPITPQMLIQLSLYAVELALWFPMLSAVEVTTAVVAKREMTRSGSWGLYIVAVELLAILLILMIPSLTHRFLSGAFSGDLDTQSGLLRTVRNLVSFRKGPVNPT
jgi:hypothetical protein